MNIHWKPRWDDWHTAQSLRENNLVCFGLYAGYLAEQGKIALPAGLEGEDAVASLGIAVVNAFREPNNPNFDEPFDCLCIEQLIQYFGNENYPEWFGHVRWHNEDIVCVLKDRGIPATEKNINIIRNKLEHHSFRDAMVAAGWDYMEYLVDDTDFAEEGGDA